jgi:hypothetical protein
VDGKVMKFSREGFLTVTDPAVANDIRQKYGDEVTVSRIAAPHPSDRGHTYFFQGVSLPWHKYDEYGRRIRS